MFFVEKNFLGYDDSCRFGYATDEAKLRSAWRVQNLFTAVNQLALDILDDKMDHVNTQSHKMTCQIDRHGPS